MADVATLVAWFDEAETASYDAREKSERDRDYTNGKQLTEKELAVLRKRGQPDVITNRIRGKVNWMRGLEAQQRTDPRAFPRTPGHEQGAEAATDAIRFVCDNTDWDTTRSEIYDNMLVEGFGGCEVVHKQGRRGIEVVINQYAWDRLFYDPHSSKADFSDARYKGAVIWADADTLKKEYPKLAGGIDTTVSSVSATETYEDKPKYLAWADARRKRVRIVLMYYKEGGKWLFAKFHKGEILEQGESPYVDEDGESVCPLIMRSVFTDRDNNRYGVVRDMISPQDEINARRSRALHLLNSRQTLGEKGAIDDVQHMKREMAKADGHVIVNPDYRFEKLDTNDLASGQLQLLQEAKGEIDLMGANSALSGETGESQSGRAVLARQQGGIIEIAAIRDQLHGLTREVYRHIWMRVRQFWTEQRWIRVTDDERNVRFVGLNRPVTLAEQLQQVPEEQAVAIARQMQLRPGDPRLDMPVGRENPVEEMDVDIQIEEVPDMVSLQGETFETLVNLATSMPGAIPPLVLIEAAPGLRRDMKDKIVKMMEEQQAAQQQQAQQAAPLQQAMAEAEVVEKQANAQKHQATAQKMMAEASAPQFAA
jgi:hypothetical protein